MLSRRRLLWFGGGWAAGLSLPRVPAQPQNGVTATADVITSRCPQFDIPDPIPPQHGIPYDVAQTRCLWQYSNVGPRPRPQISHHEYWSSIASAVTGFNIWLPDQYNDDPNRRFPVIYWCTGEGYGACPNENDEMSSFGTLSILATFSQNNPIIMVFVNPIANSKYMDALPRSSMYGIVMAESMIINEVIPVVDCRFRTIANRGGRAITGFSGGGAGCLRLAFKYPQLFCATRSCAGAVDDRGFNVLTEEPQLALAMFNNDTDAFELQTSFGQSAANRDAIIVSGLAIQMSIGNQDNLLAVNRQLDSHLTSLGIPHDPLIELPGLGHDLEGFWRVSGTQPLDFLYSHFSL